MFVLRTFLKKTELKFLENTCNYIIIPYREIKSGEILLRFVDLNC